MLADETSTNETATIAFDDDGPEADLVAVKLDGDGDGMLVHDETDGVDPGSDDQEVNDSVPPALNDLGTVIGWAQVGVTTDPSGNTADPDAAFGTDGPGSVDTMLTDDAGGDFDGDASNLFDTATGFRIFLYTEDGVVVGRVGENDTTPDDDGEIAFALLLDGGDLSLAQYRAIQHPDSPLNDDESVLLLSSDNTTALVHIKVTVTDGDGDQDMTVVALDGSNEGIGAIKIEDDGPSIDVRVKTDNDDGGPAFLEQLNLDETADDDDTAGEGDFDRYADLAEANAGDDNADEDETDLSDAGFGTPLGRLTTAAGAGDTPGDLGGLFNVNALFGTDGPAATGDVTHQFSLVLTGDGADGGTPSGVKTTLFALDDGDDNTDERIFLFEESGSIVGRVGGSGGAVAIRIALDDTESLSDAQLIVEQYLPLAHPETDLHDEQVPLALMGDDDDDSPVLAVRLTSTAKDGDDDTDTASADFVLADETSTNETAAIAFDDDGPVAKIAVNDAAMVTIDETEGLQGTDAAPVGKDEDNNDDDVAETQALIDLFSSVQDPGADPHVTMPQYAVSTSAVVDTSGSDFGRDGPGETVLSLAIEGGQGTSSGLSTTEGQPILLFLEAGLIVGRIGGANGDAVFAVALDDDGFLSVVQYQSIANDNDTNDDDVMDLVNGQDVNLIKAVVTVTDGDGDTDTAMGGIGDRIKFEDDGPMLVGDMVMNDEGTLDEGALGGIATTPEADGGEFRVNSTMNNAQLDPSVAALSDGGFVVTWNSLDQDGSNWGVYGQRYDNTGAADGPEFRVNTETLGDQRYSSVTALPDGGFVVTWNSSGQDGSDWGVYGQRYDENGAPDGGEFLVNTTTAGAQLYPDVAALPDGGFVVVWNSSDGSGRGVFGQRYDDTGAPDGGQFPVNTITAGSQLYPSVAALTDGGFVVTWMSADASASGVFGRLYDNTGAPVGIEFQVNTHTPSDQGYGAVAALADGGFLVTWSSRDQDSSDWGIFARRYDDTGAPDGGEFQVNTTWVGSQQYASVTGLSDGGFVITWNSWGQDGSGWGQYGQRYDADGNPVGTEYLINETTFGTQYSDNFLGGDSVAQLSSGDLVSTWRGAPIVSGDEIHARLFSMESGGDSISTTLDLSTRVDFGADGPGGFALKDPTEDGTATPQVKDVDGVGLTSGGVDILFTDYEVDGTTGATTLTAKANGVVIFTVEITADGQVTYTQFGSIDQSGEAGDPLKIDFGYNAADGDGDTVMDAFQIKIIADDEPVVITGLDVNGGEETVDEDDLSPDGSDQTGSVMQTGSFTVDAPDGLQTLEIGSSSFTEDQLLNSTPLTVSGTQYGTLEITGYDAGTGEVSYKYTLTGNTLDHSNAGEDSVFENLAVKATDTDGDFAEASLDIEVVDDVPTAKKDKFEVPEPATELSDVVLIVDRSGSMGPEDNGQNGSDPDGPGGFDSRLEVVQAAVEDLFNSGTVNSVFIVSFASDAEFHDSGVNGGWYTNLADALAVIDGFSANGSTDYDAAVEAVTTNFTAPPAGGDKLVSMFLSDGEPNQTNGTGSDGIDEDDTDTGTGEETAWINFLGNNNFDESFAFGFGGLSAGDIGELEPIAWKPGEVASTFDADDNADAALDENVILVTDITDLSDELIGSISPSVIGGNVLDNDVPGADGFGGIVSITVQTEDGPPVFVTFTFDPDANGGDGGITRDDGGSAISGTSFTETTAFGGKFTFHFADDSPNSAGDFSYMAGPVDQDVWDKFDYTIVDGDGDESTATLRIDVINAPPRIAVNDVEVQEGEDAVFEITLSEAASTDVTENLALMDGTAENSLGDNDYN